MACVAPTTLLGFGPQAADWQDGPLRVRVIGPAHFFRGQRQNPLSLKLLPELSRHQVVHCHQKHVLVSSLAAAAGRLLNKPVFVTNHGGGGWDISAYVSTDRWYSGELHVSQYSRQLAGQENRSWSHVIYGGIDVQRFSPVHELMHQPRAGAALFVGRLLPHKGVDVLLSAVRNDIPVDIVGRPGEAQYMEDLRTLVGGSNVRLIHDATDADLVRFYQSATCVVLPSVYRDRYGNETLVPELLGQTLLEGMACGAPALASSVTSLPEVVEDGVSGFVVAPNDPDALRAKLLWFRDHASEARVMGAAARKRVLDRFTWSAVVKRCLDVYQGKPG